MRDSDRFLSRTAGLDQVLPVRPSNVALPVDRFGLAAIAGKVFSRELATPDLDHLDLELPSVEDAMADVQRRMENLVEASFDDLIAHCHKRLEVAAYFLALLELARWGSDRSESIRLEWPHHRFHSSSLGRRSDGSFVNVRAILESILFVAENPVPIEEMAEVLEIPRTEVEAALQSMQADLEQRGSGLVLRQAGGGWRLYSHPDSLPFLERFASTASAKRLSGAALEVLAIIAYRQPVSRGQVAEIRGVDSESSIHTLERLGLIEEASRLPGPGNPAIYRTTTLFLEKVGVNQLSELPPLADHVPPAEVMDALEETFRPR